jgi:hypothetical protein
MSIDPLDPEVRPLAQMARSLGRLRDERPVSPSTLWRWASRGLRGVRLEIVRIGGTACTTPDAIRRFLVEVEARRTQTIPEQPTAPHPTRASAAAEELEVLGIT